MMVSRDQDKRNMSWMYKLYVADEGGVRDLPLSMSGERTSSRSWTMSSFSCQDGAGSQAGMAWASSLTPPAHNCSTTKSR